jgi:hypothetical protein
MGILLHGGEPEPASFKPASNQKATLTKSSGPLESKSK